MCCITKSAKMNGTALSLIARAWHRHEMAPATQHSDAGPLQSHRLLEKFNYTKEQEMLVDRMGPRVRAIHRSGNVSHFHESWMECAIVGRLSLSLWPPPRTPPCSPHPLDYFSSHSSPIGTVFLPMRAPTCLHLCGWEPFLARPGSSTYSYLREEK